jgi:hypothetical protein
MAISVPGSSEAIDCTRVSFRPGGLGGTSDPLHTVQQSYAQIVVDGPGFIRVASRTTVSKWPESKPPSSIEVVVRLRPAGNDLYLILQASLELREVGPTQSSPRHIGTWRYTSKDGTR